MLQGAPAPAGKTETWLIILLLVAIALVVIFSIVRYGSHWVGGFSAFI